LVVLQELRYQVDRTLVVEPDDLSVLEPSPQPRLTPEAISLRECVEALRRAGAIAWSGCRLRPAKPVGNVRGDKTVADLVVENRE
jgi:hypothetical protein